MTPRPRSALLALAATSLLAAPAFQAVEADIRSMSEALRKKRVTSRQLTEHYLVRIATYEDKLNAIITVNPKALEEADRLDRERARGRIRGPLHGIPIALKDNIHTVDLPTTGGALAFENFVPPHDATLTKNLRDAGAIIIAKTTLTELANWTAGSPTPMVSGYNAVAGFSFNPYDPRREPDRDGRPWLSPGGSSSGIGTAANFWAANVGTETSGSILGPANQNMLAAIKPTVGRVSRHGVIPITADQDTAGPMAKWVADAAILLGALESAQPDPNDPATSRCTPPPGRDYTKFLRADALRGARIGIPRASYYDKLRAPEAKAMSEAIEVLRRQGAVIVDPADIPSVIDPDPANNFLSLTQCGGATQAKGRDDNCSVVFKYGMKRDFNKWLATLGPSAPVKSLTGLREWNLAHRKEGAIRFGQSRLDISDEMDLDADKARYEADRARDLRIAATYGIDEAMRLHRLDAILFPGSNGYSIAAIPGYPTVIVPFAMMLEPRPAPLGVSFTGLACSEPRLIELGYAFEQATRRRKAPPFAP